jgi:hypothetical protein
VCCTDQFEELLAVVNALLAESGIAKDFDARAWLSAWLLKENPALGHVTPLAFLAGPGGFEVVRTLLLRMQSGAYS